MVEDFAVVSDPERSIFITHWLVPAGKVHNAKSSVPQKRVAVIEVADVIWSTVPDRFSHLLQNKPSVAALGLRNETDDSTHDCFSVKRDTRDIPHPTLNCDGPLRTGAIPVL